MEGLYNDYWDILRQGLRQPTSLWVSCEILTHFHTLYQACGATSPGTLKHPV